MEKEVTWCRFCAYRSYDTFTIGTNEPVYFCGKCRQYVDDDDGCTMGLSVTNTTYEGNKCEM